MQEEAEQQPKPTASQIINAMTIDQQIQIVFILAVSFFTMSLMFTNRKRLAKLF